jgi:hypothetical protein
MIPLFIAVYFVLAITPIITKTYKEIFPFFSFRLYSRILENVKMYDVMYTEADGSTHYLYFENKQIDKLERKHLAMQLRKLGKAYQKGQELNFQPLKQWVKGHHKVSFVKIYGNNIEVIQEGTYELEILASIKP